MRACFYLYTYILTWQNIFILANANIATSLFVWCVLCFAGDNRVGVYWHYLYNIYLIYTHAIMLHCSLYIYIDCVVVPLYCTCDWRPTYIPALMPLCDAVAIYYIYRYVQVGTWVGSHTIRMWAHIHCCSELQVCTPCNFVSVTFDNIKENIRVNECMVKNVGKLPTRYRLLRTRWCTHMHVCDVLSIYLFVAEREIDRERES